jgi:hypothetical protein
LFWRLRVPRLDLIFLDAHGDALKDLAGIHRLAGRADDARSALEQALQLYEQKGNLVSAGKARALLEEHG